MKKNLVILIIVAVLATVMYLISGFSQTNPVACIQEAKICPDGSTVGRTGPKCEFAPCPTTAPTGGETFCGGIAGIECPEGYRCQLDGEYPDAGGTCVRGNGTKPDTDYECPENNYVNCMPGPDKIKSECRPQYLEWVKENCPDFKGVAY